MRWPPNAAWTSAVKREGYRHFEVKSYGGKKDERWVELFPVNNNEILIRNSYNSYMVGIKNLFKVDEWMASVAKR